MQLHRETQTAAVDRSRPATPAARIVATSDAAATGGSTTFDRWLTRELRRMFDSAREEPVPDELLKLLQD